jgi:hypothetical protein
VKLADPRWRLPGRPASAPESQDAHVIGKQTVEFDISSCGDHGNRTICSMPVCRAWPCHQRVRTFWSILVVAASRAWVATAMASSMSSLVGPGLLLLGYSKLFRARRTLPNERNMRTVVPNCAVTSPAPLGARLGWLPVALAPQAGWPRSHARRHRPADRHRTDLLPPWPGTQWQGGGPHPPAFGARSRGQELPAPLLPRRSSHAHAHGQAPSS